MGANAANLSAFSTQHLEVLRGNDLRGNVLCVIAVGHRERVVADRRHRRNELGLLIPVPELGERRPPNRDLAIGEVIPVQEDQLLVILERHRLKQRGIHYGEDRRVSTERERQSEHRDERKAGAPAERPERES